MPKVKSINVDPYKPKEALSVVYKMAFSIKECRSVGDWTELSLLVAGKGQVKGDENGQRLTHLLLKATAPYSSISRAVYRVPVKDNAITLQAIESTVALIRANIECESPNLLHNAEVRDAAEREKYQWAEAHPDNAFGHNAYSVFAVIRTVDGLAKDYTWAYRNNQGTLSAATLDELNAKCSAWKSAYSALLLEYFPQKAGDLHVE